MCRCVKQPGQAKWNLSSSLQICALTPDCWFWHWRCRPSQATLLCPLPLFATLSLPAEVTAIDSGSSL
jgi:hypothetical protein